MSCGIPLNTIGSNLSEWLKQNRPLILPREESFFMREIFLHRGRKDIVFFYRIDNNFIYLPLNYSIKTTGRWAQSYNYPLSTFKFIMEDNKLPFCIDSYYLNRIFQTVKCCRTATFGIQDPLVKNMIAVYLTANLNRLCLVLHNDNEDDYVKAFSSFSDAHVWTSSENIEKQTPYINVVICHITKLHKLSFRQRKLIGTVIIDNIDTVTSNYHGRVILDLNPQFIVAFSDRVREREEQTEINTLLCGQTKFTISFPKSPLVYIFNNEINKDQKEVIDVSTLHKWKSFERTLRSRRFNEPIVNLVKNNPTKKILIVTPRDYHGNLLKDMISKNEPVSFINLLSQTQDTRVSIVHYQVITEFQHYDKCDTIHNLRDKKFDMIILPFKYNDRIIQKITYRIDVEHAIIVIISNFCSTKPIVRVKNSNKNGILCNNELVKCDIITKWYEDNGGRVIKIDSIDDINHDRVVRDTELMVYRDLDICKAFVEP